MTQVIEQPETVTQPIDMDRLTHYICDIHTDLALCGEQLRPGGSIFDNSEDAGCPLCREVWESGANCVIPDCPGVHRSRIRRWIERWWRR